MYGRAEPKPVPAQFSGEERAAMRRAQEAERAAARAMLAGAGGPAYAAVELPPQLSLDCQRYKWRQSQSHVEVFVPLPVGLPARAVHVQLSTRAISIVVDEAPVLSGELWREIKAEESHWYISDGVLEVVMLKRCRRGHYEAGTTNAGGCRGWGCEQSQQREAWSRVQVVRCWVCLHVQKEMQAGTKSLVPGAHPGQCTTDFCLDATVHASRPRWVPTCRHILEGGGAACSTARDASLRAPAAGLLQLPMRGAGAAAPAAAAQAAGAAGEAGEADRGLARGGFPRPAAPGFSVNCQGSWQFIANHLPSTSHVH